jgi:hypothetical protein
MVFMAKRFKFDEIGVFLDASIFAALAALTISNPNLAWGSSIGFEGMAILIGILLFAVSVCGLSVRLLLFSLNWSWRVPLVHAVLTMATTIFVNDMILNAADSQFGLAKSLIENKITYFCDTHFDGESCVQQVNICANCAQILAPEKRPIVAGRLRAFKQMAAEREPAAGDSK